MTNGAAGVLFYNNRILTETSAGSSANVHCAEQPDARRKFGSRHPQRQYQPTTALPITTGASRTPERRWHLNGNRHLGMWPGLRRPAPRRVQAAGATVPAPSGSPRSPRRGWQRCGKPCSGNAPLSQLAEYSKATHRDEHSVPWDFDIFVNVKKLDARNLKKVQQIYKAEDSDFRLKPDSTAVDQGTSSCPTLHTAPPVGAREAGQPVPHYGPRR